MPLKPNSPISKGNFKVLETFSCKDDKRMLQTWVLMAVPPLCRSCNSAGIFSWTAFVPAQHSTNSLFCHYLYLWGQVFAESRILIRNVLGGGKYFGLVDAHFVSQRSLDTWPSPAVAWCLTSLRRWKVALATLSMPLLHVFLHFRKVYILVYQNFVSFLVSFCQQSLI